MVIKTSVVHFERSDLMPRPGYMNIRVDEETQQIFDEFIKIKGVTKSKALSEMVEIYMLCQDEMLFLELKKKYLGVKIAKQELLERIDSQHINDYIFIKLGITYDKESKPLDGLQTINAYQDNMKNNGLGYSWFSTRSLHFGMARKKVNYYNQMINKNNKVTILFAIGDDINDICYSADVLNIVSDKDLISCPGEIESIPEILGTNEKGKIWIKIANLREENELQAAMFNVRSTGTNLKDVITTSQFHFGYVHLANE